MKSILLFCLISVISSVTFASGNSCSFLFKDSSSARISEKNKSSLSQALSTKETVPVNQVVTSRNSQSPKTAAVQTWTTESAWAESQSSLQKISQYISGKENVMHGLLTAMLAKEFVWLNGDPGGAKTFVSRIMFRAALNSIPEKDKKIFVLQFHKLMTEGIITGFPKLKALLESGRYELETESSLVGEKYLFLIADEAEKANPATLTALLSVLNERKAFLGSRVVDAALSSGVFTSNKTMAEFLQSGKENRPGLEALADRQGIKIHVPNMQASPQDFVKLYDAVKAGSTSELNTLRLPVQELQLLVSKVKIPEDLFIEIAKLIQNFDELVTGKADSSLDAIRSNQSASDILQEYFPANQFSNRSNLKLLNIMKASFIAEQLLSGKKLDQLSYEITKKDLHHLATSAIYGGPAKIQHKRYDLGSIELFDIFVRDQTFDVSALWNPYSRELTINEDGKRPQLGTHVIRIDESTESFTKRWGTSDGFILTAEQVDSIKAKIKKAEAESNFDPDVVQYEVDPKLTNLLANKAIPTRTRIELESIQSDMRLFVDQLNAIQGGKLKSEGNQLAQLRKQIDDLKAKQRIWSNHIKSVATNKNMTAQQKLKAYYDSVQFSLRALKFSFQELDHSIMAHFVSILSGQHVYVFGPPGGAKTALAKQILTAAINWENIKNPGYTEKQMQRFLIKFKADLKARSPEAHDLFFLQFHPMVPEGSIVGFPKLQAQIDSGKLEIDFSTSLGNQKFMFAILDEVEKGNPAVLSSLLSALNEREIFFGQDVIKISLRSAVMTSNKMLSEFLDSFGEDRPTGKALSDRAINKTYVPNKFSSPEALARFMMQYEAGLKSELSMSLPLLELKPLVDQVQFDDYTKTLLATVINRFTSKRLEEEEKSWAAHMEDSAGYPDYYVKSTQGSDRSGIQYLDQLKAHFILHQLESGVKFEDLRYTVELSDIHLLAGGLAYWGPYKLTPKYNQNGILEFELNDAVLQKLSNAPYVNSRNKYMLRKIKEEAEDFKSIANDEIYRLTSNLRHLIAKSPSLFPTLFASDEARREFLEKNKPLDDSNSGN